MQSSGYLAVSNAEAGSSDDDVVQAALAELEGSGPVIRAPADDAGLDTALRGADGACVVVLGGDGSLHRVVNRMRTAGRLDLDVALVPLGTGNDLARGAGIPLDPHSAAAGLVRWRAHPVDLLQGNDQIVVNAMHLGLGAVAAQRAGRWKARIGAIAYPLGAVAAGTWARPWQLKVVVDGRVVHDGPTVLAGVGNGVTIGGGTRMFPRARLDDGRAEVLVAPSRFGPYGRAVFGYALRSGRPSRPPWVRMLRGRRIEVSGEAVTGNADGEIWEPAERWRVDVLPAALRLRRP